MKGIRVEKVTKTFNDEVILHNLSLDIPWGKIFVLLGPSGCGKTTLLRAIGGFERVDSGKIFLGARDITDLEINKRPINTVFQNYALFPHLNVFENVAYSLKLQKMPPALIKKKVEKMLDTVRLQKHAFKRIGQLSGGQQQRVALARAIITEPEVLLLDEPLAALDSTLRERVLVDLIALQDTLKTTFIYVTHDQSEALAVADQMAIMNYDGEIEQHGTPKEIYEYPISSFVAQFVGTSNIFEGILKDEFLVDVCGIGELLVSIATIQPWMVEGAHVRISVRPEKIFISTKERPGFSNTITGIVESIVYHGRSTLYNVRLRNGMLVQVFEQNEEHLPQETIDYDSLVYLTWQKENVVLLER